MDISHYAFTIAVATVGLLFYFAYTIFFKKVDEPETQSKRSLSALKTQKWINLVPILEESKSTESAESTEKKTKSNTKIDKKSAFKPTKAKEVQFKHKWLAATLKAHSDRITGIDFSSNGKYLLSCGLGKFTSKLFVFAFDDYNRVKTR